MLCPKCSKKRAPEEKSCSRCGLTFALWKPDDGPPVVQLDSQGEALWKNLESHWTDSALHEEFLKHCLQSSTLAAAGRRYRAKLDENPKDAVAAEMQRQLLAKAALGLTINQSYAREPVTRTRWFWVVIILAMALGIAGGLLWRKTH
jgi:hypothetical protein